MTGSGAGSASGAGASLEPSILRVGEIQNKNISESSGLVSSRDHPGLFWTHNDRGHEPVLYGMDRNGHAISQHRIQAALEDWEDLAIDGSGHLYLGDLGNNDLKRSELAVYQIKEPDPTQSPSPINPLQRWILRFPGAPFDCESLFIDGAKGYVISKVFDDAQAQIFQFDLGANQGPQTLQWVATLPVTSPVTGADLSSDRKRLGIVCKAGAYVFFVHGDIASAGQAEFHRDKFKKGQIEACSLIAEGMLVTEEGRDIYLFSDPAYRTPQ